MSTSAGEAADELPGRAVAAWREEWNGNGPITCEV